MLFEPQSSATETHLQARNSTLSPGDFNFRDAQNATRTRFACILKQAETLAEVQAEGLWPHRAAEELLLNPHGCADEPTQVLICM